jgi:UDP-N-acetyl-D-glucosamine dehydrogenase
MNDFKSMMDKIKKDEVVVGVLGLGYVGLPLAVAFAKKDINVIGFEKDIKKADMVNSGKNYIGDVVDEELKKSVEEKKLEATTDFSRIKECDAIMICVPTPLDKFKKPNMTYIEESCKDTAKYMKKGTFISLESTTYPTTTENFMLPLIEKYSKMKVNKDFWLCFSPERVDPGNFNYKTENTPKVVGAITEEGMKIAEALYLKAIEKVHMVSSPRIAEMVKTLENTYRLVNISLINELTLLAGKMDIDMWEVIDAAKTKPYGFQAFYPGPGIGGHCIPLDPFYLEYIAKEYNFDLTMINTAGHIENLMAHRMVIKIQTGLNRQKKSLNGSKILVLGVAYKANIDDCRESPSLRIIEALIGKGSDVMYHDAFVDKIKLEDGKFLNSTILDDKLLEEVDCVVIPIKHKGLDYDNIAKKAKLVVDMKNATKGKMDKVVRF